MDIPFIRRQKVRTGSRLSFRVLSPKEGSFRESWIYPMRPGESADPPVSARIAVLVADGAKSAIFRSSFGRIFSVGFDWNFWAQAEFRAIRPPSHFKIGRIGLFQSNLAGTGQMTEIVSLRYFP